MNTPSTPPARSLPDKLLLITLAAYLLLGLALVGDYGESWDNAWFYQYGQQSVEIYRQPFASYSLEDYGPVDTYNFGPVVVTSANLVARGLAAFGATLSPLVIHRYIYFLFYVFGAAALYPLGKRLMPDWAALFATLLLFTQPLFFGQALVNPKDTPFMGLFIASIYLGLKMVNAADQPNATGNRWALSARQRKGLVAWVAVLFLWLIFQMPLINLLQGWVTAAFQASPESGMGRLFALIASRAGDAPLAGYLAKVSVWVGRLVWGLLALSAVLIVDPKFFKRLLAALRAPGVLPAGLLLGLSISVRVLGVGAAALVLLADLLTNWQGWRPYRALAYLTTAAVSIYLTWPYLWPAPLQRLLASMQVNFGHANSAPLWFDGQRHPSNQLPWQYVPKLLSIQLTEPLVILGLLGAGLLVWRWLREKQVIDLVLLGWLFAPLTVLMILRPSLHDNLRHVFFIIPPLCLYVGVLLTAGYNWLLDRIKITPAAQLALGLLLAAGLLGPGVAYIVRYHPYEYVYYNQFIGGIEGAKYRYEMDYLGISTSEAFAYINQQAEPGATIFVIMQFDLAEILARPDLILIDRFDNPELPVTAENTYLITSLAISDSAFGSNIFQAQIGSMPLATVQRLRPGD